MTAVVIASLGIGIAAIQVACTLLYSAFFDPGDPWNGIAR